MWTALGMGVSVSLIAAAIYDYATGNHVRALIMGAAGLAAFFVAYFFSKKKPELTLPPALMKNSGNATATATGGAGGHASIVYIVLHLPPAHPSPESLETLRDNARREASLIEYIQQTPNMTY